MAQFRYVARNAQGELVDGMLTCNDRAAALRQIEQLKCVPIKIEPVQSAPEGGDSASASGKTSGKSSSRTAPSSSAASEKPVATGPVRTLSHAQVHLFTEQLAHLLSAGMTLDEALGVLVKRMKHPKLGGLSQALHRALVDGRSLSQAMREFPKIFSPLYVNMVSAGEASGALAEILRRLVLHLADIKALRDRVQMALVYPAVLVVAGIALIIVFMTVMVPRLMSFFEQTGQKLPMATQILLKTNHIISHYWWAFILAGAGVYFLWKMFVRTAEGRHAWDAFAWRFPLVSLLLRYRFYAQFARTLGTLMQNGVTLLRALELLEEIAGNEFVRRRMVDVRDSVVDGVTLSVALQEQNLFPELFIDMMAVGEQTGKFSETMHIIADIYERELDKQVKVVAALVPPIVLLFIAMLVGLVVYGILSAVFSMTQGLRSGGR